VGYVTCYGGSTQERLLSESSRSYTDSVSYICNMLSVEIAQGLFGLNLKHVLSILNVDSTSSVDKMHAVIFKICYFGFPHKLDSNEKHSKHYVLS
jgi:hypothetical protein